MNMRGNGMAVASGASRNNKQRRRQRNGRNPGGAGQATRGVTNAKSMTTFGVSSAGPSHQQADAVVVKEELVALVSGSTTFAATQYALQPANATSFPLGYVEAQHWTEWSCDRMEYEFIPTVSQYATQGQIGEVVGGFDYNAANAAPTAMNQIQAMDWAGGGIPAERWCLKLQPRMINRADPKYIRTGTLPSGDDIRLYDGGNFWFCTNGCTNNNQIGKLVVRYYFRVRKPTLLNAAGGGGGSSSIAFFQSTTPESAGATTVAKQLAVATASVNTLAAVNTAGSIVPPAGTYVVTAGVSVTQTAGGYALAVAQLDLLKNGTSVLTGSKPISNNQSGFTACDLEVTAVIVCNGTDAITLVCTDTYTSGDTTNSGRITLST
jgi:hypothetical protein